MSLQEKQKEENVDADQITDKVRNILVSKANQDEVKALNETKANKFDTEMCLRWVDLLHRMVKQIVHIYSMHLKGDIDTQGYENPNTKQNRKVELLYQALIVSKWVDSFDSQNISDFYLGDSNSKKDPALIERVSQQFTNALIQMEQTKLSPNNKDLNDALQLAKTRMSPDVKQSVFNKRAKSTLVHNSSQKALSAL